MADPVTPRPRFDVIDMARGVALVAMVVYHFFWDLSFLRFFPVDVSADFAWMIFARSILSSFLFLVGVGLVLGHGRVIRWRAFWKRLALVAAGAAIITIATLVVFPQSFVYFGILHAIALFSLLALAFLRAPIWLVTLAAAIVMAIGWGYSDPSFNERLWSWLGFWTVPPPANDLVPIFPWFGMVLAGIVATRLLLASPWVDRLAAIRATAAPARLLVLLGRWSLLLYLLHQPLLLSVLYPLSMVMQPGLAQQNTAFLNNCQATCLASGSTDKQCTTYCHCGLTGVIDNDLWDAVNSGAPRPDEAMALDVITKACSALIYPAPPSP